MTVINRTMGPLEWALLLTLSVLWGASFFFGQVALAELRPFTVALARVAIAALVLNLLVRLSGLRMPRTLAEWRRLFAMGALNNAIPFSLLLWGQTQISSSLASILNATAPLFTVLLADRLTADEKLTPLRLMGVVAGLAGVIVMIGPSAMRDLGGHLMAELVTLGAPIAYACASIYGRRFRNDPPLVTAAGQVTASTLLLLPIMLVFDRPWTLVMPSGATLAALVGLALLSTALAYVIFFRILATAGSTNLQLVTFLIPVSALLFGMGILGERLAPEHFAGMALIGLGLAFIDGRLWRKLRGRSADCNGRST